MDHGQRVPSIFIVVERLKTENTDLEDISAYHHSFTHSYSFLFSGSIFESSRVYPLLGTHTRGQFFRIEELLTLNHKHSIGEMLQSKTSDLSDMEKWPSHWFSKGHWQVGNPSVKNPSQELPVYTTNGCLCPVQSHSDHHFWRLSWTRGMRGCPWNLVSSTSPANI